MVNTNTTARSTAGDDPRTSDPMQETLDRDSRLATPEDLPVAGARFGRYMLLAEIATTSPRTCSSTTRAAPASATSYMPSARHVLGLATDVGAARRSY